MMSSIVMLLLFTHVSAQEYTQNGAIITKPGVFELNDPNPMTIKVNKYAECSGIIDICYKSHTELNDAFGNCPNNFCFLGIDVSTQSSQWGKGAVQGSSMLFMISREERCQPETKEGRHTYKFLDVPRNCEVEIVGATDPKTTEEPTTSTTTEKSKTTTTNVEKSSANVTIIIVCGVLGFILYVCSN